MIPLTHPPLFLKKGKRIVSINPSAILYIEAEDDYIKVITAVDKQLFNYTMRAMEEKLCRQSFIRVHRSYIINLHYVKYIEDSVVNLDRFDIPIHQSYSAAFIQKILT